MSILSFLRKKSHTASVAKERLQIIISHERAKQHTPDFLPQLQEEILAVISKYIPSTKDVSFNVEKLGGQSILELNITMPEEETA
jgi:cell division topological specificity factor